MRLPTQPVTLLSSVMLLSVCGGPVTHAAGDDELPPGVEQILPRGRIAAIFEPEFVPAAKAEIPSDAWILGVVIEGEPKAYSLNLLNRHEVVNDKSGNTEFAAVW